MAQNSSGAGQVGDPNEIIVLSSYVDGAYNVEQYMVMEDSPTVREFVAHYKISTTQLSTAWGTNSAEIEALKNFTKMVEGDSTKTIIGVDVVGYTSPDGSAAFNKRIAEGRASNADAFLVQNCAMGSYPRSVSSNPYLWIDTKAALESSAVPNKREVLAAIQSSKSQSEIQRMLEGYPAAWSYICDKILPPMRCTEIDIKYNAWRVVESRTLVEQSAPQEDIYLVETNSYNNVGSGAQVDMSSDQGASADMEIENQAFIDDNIDCFIVEMPQNAIDFKDKHATVFDKLKMSRHGAKFKERGAAGRAKVKERERRLRLWSKR